MYRAATSTMRTMTEEDTAMLTFSLVSTLELTSSWYTACTLVKTRGMSAGERMEKYTR